MYIARSFPIPIQIECSDEACVIMMTLIFAFASVDNSFLEYPGIPTIPLPSSVSKAMFDIAYSRTTSPFEALSC